MNLLQLPVKVPTPMAPFPIGVLLVTYTNDNGDVMALGVAARVATTDLGAGDRGRGRVGVKSHAASVRSGRGGPVDVKAG